MSRFMLKLSGEALAGDGKNIFDPTIVQDIARQVKALVDGGHEVGIVIGGGNIWRGRTGTEIDRTKSDQIGMLATIMNSVYVSEVFRSAGMKTQIFSSLPCGTITKPFSKDEALECLTKKTVVFFAAGTGHPYFSTDTGVVLRAVEIEADLILLAKAVDGVYSDDPKDNPNAEKYAEISIKDVVANNLGVIDQTAAVLARDNRMPMRVFGLIGENSIVNAVSGKNIGTEITVD